MDLNRFLEIVKQQDAVKYLHVDWLKEWRDEHEWDFDKALTGLNALGIVVFAFTDDEQMVVAQPRMRRATRVERGKLNQEADVGGEWGEWDAVEDLVFGHTVKKEERKKTSRRAMIENQKAKKEREKDAST